jgi:hypothetical protein
VSADHMVFISKSRSVKASSLQVGDRIMKASGLSDQDTYKITSLRTVWRQGMYAPFTASGTVVVSGILASCYVGFDGPESLELIGGLSFSYQFLAHLAETPHRLWCRAAPASCLRETYTERGLSQWQVLPFELARALLLQPTMVKAPSVTVGMALLLPLRVVEMLLDASVTFHVLSVLVVFVTLLARRRRVLALHQVHLKQD